MMQHLKTETIVDYINGALPAQEDAAAFTHIESCAACRQEHAAELALSEALRSYASREERELPSTLKAEIWSRIRAATPSAWSRIVASLRPRIAIPAVAALALAAYIGSGYLSPHGAPTIEASYYLRDHASLNSTVPFSDHSSAMPVELENSAAVNTQQTAVNVQAASSYTADANP